MRPAWRASSLSHSCAVPWTWAARPPLLAISRCFCGSIDANPRPRPLRSVAMLRTCLPTRVALTPPDLQPSWPGAAWRSRCAVIHLAGFMRPHSRPTRRSALQTHALHLARPHRQGAHGRRKLKSARAPPLPQKLCQKWPSGGGNARISVDEAPLHGSVLAQALQCSKLQASVEGVENASLVFELIILYCRVLGRD